MIYEIPVTFKKYHQLSRVLSGDASFCFFQMPEDDQDTAFLLAHGSEDGGIQINGELYTAPAVLQWLLNHDIKARGITEVYTISCHGGAQQSAVIDGVSIKSIHSSMDEIQASVVETIDDEYFLSFTVKEGECAV